MRADGVNVEATVRSGALSLVCKRDTYLKQGHFDPDWMVRFLTEATDAAKAARFSALRVSGEMTWALGRDPGAERLTEYEAKLNRFFPNQAALAICQYSGHRFSPEVIRGVIRTHPQVVFGETVCRNFYYVPPDEFLKPDQASLEVKRLIENIGARQRAEALRLKVQAALEATNQQLKAEVVQRELAEKASERRRRAAESLAELSSLAAQSLDPADVGGRIVDSIQALLGVKFARLLRLEPESGDLVTVTVSRNLEAFSNITSPRGVGVAGLAARERRPVTTANMLKDPRITTTPELRARAEALEIHAALAVPLMAQNRVIGVLGLGDTRERTFDDEDHRVAQAFADQAAVALENARLYTEATRRQREAEGLARAAQALTETLDLETVGRRVVETLLPLFGVRSSALRLLQPDGSLVGVAWAGAVREHLQPGHTLPPGTGVIGRAAAEGRPVASRDVMADPDVVLTDGMRALNAATASAPCWPCRFARRARRWAPSPSATWRCEASPRPR